MSCCSGQATAVMTNRHRWLIEYLGTSSIEVVGPATQTIYQFTQYGDRQLIDPRDGASFIRSRAFRLANVVELDAPSLTEKV